ncbi:hypothetical protein [Chelatococcus reniformis]|uniref:hypothetical protein n=1 Tax=Chelatococcus reniformis TaxID=1494448 RepID=UPI001AEE352C|nr:hypothetical protein [Chelatococcus reniformis]
MKRPKPLFGKLLCFGKPPLFGKSLRFGIAVALLCPLLTPAPAAAQLILQGAQPQMLKRQPPGESKRPARPGAAGGSSVRSATSHGLAQRPAVVTPTGPAVAGRFAEPTLFGTDLYLNGNGSSLKLTRAGNGVSAELKLAGRAIGSPDQLCQVDMASTGSLLALGSPDGLPRYRIDAPVCPIDLDVMDDAVIANGPDGGACTFTQAQCRAEVTGLWGPKGTSLGPKVRDIERERGRADAALRDVFRQVLARARGPEVTREAAEQAGFSSRRSMQCANYVAEDSHGFCNTRLTQARVAGLRARLSPQATAEARAQTPRPAAAAAQ